MKSFWVLALVVVTVCVAACNPRGFPGFKQLAKQQEERITRETEEAIKKSPVLQDLDRLCTQEILRPEGFVPINKYKDLHGERFLGYGYQSKADFSGVESFYVSYFVQHGWNLTKQDDRKWGFPKIEFRNQKYQVKIYDAGQDGEINYLLHCELLEPSVKEMPR